MTPEVLNDMTTFIYFRIHFLFSANVDVCLCHFSYFSLLMCWMAIKNMAIVIRGMLFGSIHGPIYVKKH